MRQRVPRFEDYPVRRVYAGRRAPVLLDADSRMFRTRLREAARGRPNFAGHYTVALWGCGAGCVTGALVDAKTGRVYWLPRQAWLDYDAGLDFEPVRFRSDSRLLIMFGTRDESDDAEFGTHYYEFDGSRFRHLRFVPKAGRG